MKSKIFLHDTVYCTPEQKAAFKKLAALNPRITETEHKRLAYDMYLSQPQIMEALKEAEIISSSE